jgi:hypothetical protein
VAEIDLKKMLPLYGKWTASTGSAMRFSSDGTADASHGLALLPNALDDGVLECDVQLPRALGGSGAFITFRGTGQTIYYAAGLGGWEGAYTLAEGHGLTLTRLSASGNISNLVPDRIYKLKIALEGQRVLLSIDGVTVIDYDRLPTSTGTGLGFFAFRGTEEVLFGPMRIDDRRPNAFIAMQFSEPYNEVYRDAIRPLVAEIGFEPFRVDEAAGPGIILNDIWGRITEASVMIAEVSEANPNVYYEVGVAHALRKPTVLLAQRGTKLPFDLGPHRCIFYDNSIPGRARLLDALRSSLISLLGLPIAATPAIVNTRA